MGSHDEPVRNQAKHKKYQQYYKSNDIFWGLGVEHETYLESASKFRLVTEKDIQTL